MEAIAVCCAKCGWKAKVPVPLAGKRIRCRQCQTPVPVPAVQAPPEMALPQAIPLGPEVQPTPPPVPENTVEVTDGVRSFWGFLLQVKDFYWGTVGLFMRRMLDVLPWRDPAARPPEVFRLYARQSYLNAEFHDGGWDVRLPDCCVVCGRDAEHAGTDIRRVGDLYWATALPVLFVLGDVVLAFLLAVLTRGVRAPFLVAGPLVPVAILCGCVVGYLVRREIPVSVRLRRCTKHRTQAHEPQLLAYARTLILCFADLDVRQRFRREGMAKAEAVKAKPKKPRPEREAARDAPQLPAPTEGLALTFERERIVVRIGTHVLLYPHKPGQPPTIEQFLAKLSRDLDQRQVDVTRADIERIESAWPARPADEPLPLGADRPLPDVSIVVEEEPVVPMVMEDALEITADDLEPVDPAPPRRNDDLVLPVSKKEAAPLPFDDATLTLDLGGATNAGGGAPPRQPPLFMEDAPTAPHPGNDDLAQPTINSGTRVKYNSLFKGWIEGTVTHIQGMLKDGTMADGITVVFDDGSQEAFPMPIVREAIRQRHFVILGAPSVGSKARLMQTFAQLAAEGGPDVLTPQAPPQRTPLEFPCPHCKKTLTVERAAVAQEVQCPGCQARVIPFQAW